MGLCYPGFFPIPKREENIQPAELRGSLGRFGRSCNLCKVILKDFSGILYLMRMCLKVVPALQRSGIKRSRIESSGCQCERSVSPTYTNSSTHQEVYGWSVAYQRIVVIFLFLLTYPRLVQVKHPQRHARRSGHNLKDSSKRPSIQSTKLIGKLANHSTKDQLSWVTNTNWLKNPFWMEISRCLQIFGSLHKPPKSHHGQVEWR